LLHCPGRSFTIRSDQIDHDRIPLFEHDLFGKPVPASPAYALAGYGRKIPHSLAAEVTPRGADHAACDGSPQAPSKSPLGHALAGISNLAIAGVKSA